MTDEEVYTIVNPAHPWLERSQDGVIRTILIKGGSQIIDDSLYIMSRLEVPLQPGETVYT